jgi:hypothetical protein
MKLTIQPTVSLVPTPTPISTQAVPSSTPEQTGVCSHSYFFEPAPGSCPFGQPVVSSAAEQPFEGGVMVWIEASDSIVVLYDDRSWQEFEDTWSLNQPESDPSYVPPAERFQPIRGFGKVWRDWPGARDRLGWALSHELAFETTFQSQDTGTEIPGVRFVKLFNGQVAALISRGPDGGEWVIAAAGS